MIHRKKLVGYLIWPLIMLLCVSCASVGPQSGTQEGSAPGNESLSADEDAAADAEDAEEPDTEGPVISGVQALTVSAGEALSYRSGVTAIDDRDGTVMLLVDSSGVDLSVPGEYLVTYSAEDSSGNRTEVVTTVVVMESEADSEPAPAASGADLAGKASLEKVNDLADQVLAKIVKDGMSQQETARAIFNYVNSHVKYVGTSNKSSWIVGAYISFITGRGDCFNYYACSKALLTRAGIPNVDIQRVGGPTRHYWQLVDVGSGYYHFDACPHDKGYPIISFMLTEAEAREYTSWRGKNYYVYDYESCPVTVASTPFSGTAWHAPSGTPSTEPEPEPAPEVTPGTAEPGITEPEVPEVNEPAQPEIPETTGPETPPEPAGEIENGSSGADGAVQDGAPESPAEAPPGEAEDAADNAAQPPEGEED